MLLQVQSLLYLLNNTKTQLKNTTMKLLITLFASFGLLCNISSQSLNVPFQKKPFLTKTTASWSSSCGDYLWLTDSIHDTHHDSIVFVNFHVATSTIGDFYSGKFHNEINGGGSISAFNVDGTRMSKPHSYNTIMSFSSGQIAAPIIANIAFKSVQNGNNLTVNTTTEFFDNSSGEFYVNVFIVENDISAQQNTANGYIPAIHKRVSRGPIMSGNSGIWGEQIATGSVTSGSRYDVSFTTTLNSAWVTSNLEIVAVIWRKDAGVYETLNSEDIESPLTTSTIENSNLSKINVYPNPALNVLNIENIVGVQQFELIDISGKIVKSGTLSEQSNTISLGDLTKGSYMLRVTSAKRTSLQKIIIN